MSNPIRFFEHLRDMYLRYLDSPFDLRYEDLSRERRELLDHGQAPGDRAEESRRAGQVVKTRSPVGGTGLVERTGQARVAVSVRKVKTQVFDSGGELVPLPRARPIGAQAAAQLFKPDVGVGDRQDPQPARNLARPPAFQQRRDELAAGQIAGRSEDDYGGDYCCCSRGRTAWPPNC